MKSSETLHEAKAVFQSIGVAGAGAWGTALAYCAHAAGRSVRVWAREPDVAEALTAGQGNPVFLPDVALPALSAGSDIAALAACDAILLVVPAQHLRSALSALAPHISPGTPLALCAKGIEQSSLKLATEILAETIPDASPAVLSGPSFAADVARGLPTAVTLASPNRAEAEAWAQAIGRPNFRIYWSDDMIGAEIGGAVKNVLAIACGVSEGMGLGRSAHAALIARGFAEMLRLGTALGARQETMAGLSGLGDLVLTCSSPQSRNMSFGLALGQGETAAEILARRSAVTEGAATAPALVALAKKAGVEMPICEATARLIDGSITARQAMEALLNRPFREET
ncbi:MAG: NAD(P)H-dependent glycerol-3-phosphate dehydrogenase [Hyphomonadaceae bacterium]